MSVQEPKIGHAPQDITTSPETGKTVTLSVSAVSPDNGTITYQWYVNDSPISGATGSVLTLPADQPLRNVYRVEVTNSRTEKGITNSESWTSGDIHVQVEEPVPEPAEEPVPEPSDPGENPAEEPATENPIEEPKVEAAFPANASVKNSSAPTIASYKVYIASVENGTITADLENAKPGDTVKVTATPDAGYALESISVKTDDGQEVPVTEVGGGVFTFTMPNGHVTINAVFVPVKADVPPVSEKAQTAENSAVEAAETTSEDASLTGSGISLNILPIELEFVKDSEPAELQAEPSTELVAEPWTETAVVEPQAETAAVEPQVEPIAVDSQVEAVTEPQAEPVVLEAQAETQTDSALPEETMTLQ